MQYSFGDRLRHAWNIFKSRDPTEFTKLFGYYGGADVYRPDYNRSYFGPVNDRSIVTAIKNRIAVDAAQIDLQHVRLDDNNRYVETIDSGLNRCLTVEANIDQTGRAFRLDIFFTLLDEGVIAIVPVDTTVDPMATGSYEINTMRIGKITQWYPDRVQVSLYNEKLGKREEIIVPKKMAAIVENPFYAVMNEPNSVFQRLIHKLALLDAVDEQSSSGKLDLIIQLPYVVKTEQRREQANKRREDIEKQLAGSKYGIAYTDGTERIQQLNRPLENNLLAQIKYLIDLAYSQTGITPEILNGTADEKTMLNYTNRILEPLVSAVADSMKRTFLTKTAITQHQSVEYFKDPFSLVPVNQIADIADRFTRNEIMTSNEVRQIVGMKPSDDPNADQLRNKNLYDTTGVTNLATAEQLVADEEEALMTEGEYLSMVQELDDLDAQIDELEADLNGTAKHSDSGGSILIHNYDPKYRQWYYQYVEKQGKTLGRGSTAGLNEEGKARARYIRENIANDRNADIEAHKNTMNSNIETSRSNMNRGIEQSKYRQDTGISRSKGVMTSAIERSQNQRDSRISENNEQREREIQAEKEKTEREIETHANQMQSKIDSLRERLASLSKDEKASQRDPIKNEIAELREENRKKRSELRDAYKELSTGIRNQTKSENEEVRQEHKETSAKAREEHANESAKLKEEHKSTSSSMRESHKEYANKQREEHKTYSKAAKEEYDDAYEKELEYIKSLPEYQAVKKSSSSKSSKSSSSTTVIGYTKSGKAIKKKNN